MIVEIEKPRPSCRASLDYNEDKVLRGVAELVAYANMPSSAKEDIYGFFERCELTRNYVAEKSFHASVNPSAIDTCTEEDVLGFVSAMMGHLGYGSQPYLVYRHFDIEREHYHVVSVRVDRSGRKINNYYEKRRVSAFMREVAARYGFTVAEKGSSVALRDDLGTERRPRAARFNPRKGVASQLLSIYGTALCYDHDSFRQLSAILEDYGVKAALVEGSGAPSISLQGFGRSGRPTTEVFSEAVLGEPLHAKAAAAWKENGKSHSLRSREKERVRRLVGFAFGLSRSESHFVNILRNIGIGVHLSRTTNTGEVFGMILVDHTTRTVFKASELRDILSVRMMRDAVATGKWRHEDRGAGRISYVRSSRAAAREDALRLRDLHVGAVARILKPVGQPQGASWSGRAPSEGPKGGRKEGNAGSKDADFRERIA